MCGFSGIISKHEINSEFILKSISAIKHRGENDSLLVDATQANFFSTKISSETTQNHFPTSINHTSKVWLGFNRLSIVDLSERAMQPFYDKESGWFCMVNGEIYNYENLQKTHSLRCTSQSDSEVAFKLFLLKGNSFIHDLQGMFSIVLYQTKTQELKVWRDRLGIKPFYYALVNDVFLFSSEIKGIVATELVAKEIEYQNLAYSMYLGTCPAPKTIYKNIHSLQAGFHLSYHATKGISTEKYWNLRYNEDNSPISTNELTQDIRELAKSYGSGDVNKGIMLSGGFDSGTLAYFLGKEIQNLTAFHLHDEANSEVEFAQLNAKNAQIPLHLISVFQDIKMDKNAYQTIEEEPNITLEPVFFLCENISKTNIKIVYNALGIDELFGGYSYYKKANSLNRFRFFISLFPSFLLPKKYREKLKSLQKFGLESLPFVDREVFTWNEICDFLQKRNEAIPQHPIAFLLEQLHEIYPEFHELPLLKKISYLDVFYYISSHHSMRSDQPSMRFGLEMRFPYLEHTFVEKYFNKSLIFYNINSNLKPQFRTFSENILPKNVLEMPKKGFSIQAKSFFPEKDFTEKEAMKKWYMESVEKLFTTFKP